MVKSSSDKLHLPGYCIIHRDCCNDSKGGGFAIYHSDELSVKRRIDLEHETYIQQIVLEVYTPNRSPFLVSSVLTLLLQSWQIKNSWHLFQKLLIYVLTAN